MTPMEIRCSEALGRSHFELLVFGIEQVGWGDDWTVKQHNNYEKILQY